MSIGVIKEVAWAAIVYIPSMMAFASAFHCFLLGDPIFESWITSALKVLTMVIGEYNFDHHFAYHAVHKWWQKHLYSGILTKFGKSESTNCFQFA